MAKDFSAFVGATFSSLSFRVDSSQEGWRNLLDFLKSIVNKYFTEIVLAIILIIVGFAIVQFVKRRHLDDNLKRQKRNSANKVLATNLTELAIKFSVKCPKCGKEFENSCNDTSALIPNDKYQALEKQLFRDEIHDEQKTGDDNFKWSSDSVIFRLECPHCGTVFRLKMLLSHHFSPSVEKSDSD